MEKQTNKTKTEVQGKSYEFNTSLQVYRHLFEFMDGRPYSDKEIDSYLRDPQTFNAPLRHLCQWAYRVNGSVAAAVNYARSMHTLDSIITCKIKRKGDKKPRNYKRNSATFNAVLETIRYRELIRDMILRCCVEGTYFYYLETEESALSDKKTLGDHEIWQIRQVNSTDINATIISLPTDFCKIVGRKNNSYIMAFDMRYINRFGTTEEQARILRGLPAEIRNAYSYYEEGKSDPWLILDYNHTIVGKIRTRLQDPWGEPLILPALPDVMYLEGFIKTKRNVLDKMNHQVIYQTFPPGQTAGTSALTEKQQSQQHEMVKQAILNLQNQSGTSFFSLPAETKIDQLTVDGSIFEDDTENDVRDNVASDIGIAPSVLTGNATGNYATSTLNIERFASHIYTYIDDFVSELNKVVNACVIRDSSCPVNMYILPITFVNRDKVVEQMRQLYTSGKGSLMMWIASTGMNPEAYLSLMDYELDEDFEHKYPVHMTSFTATSNSDGDTGRPEAEDSDNESTIATRANGGNLSPKPSV